MCGCRVSFIKKIEFWRIGYYHFKYLINFSLKFYFSISKIPIFALEPKTKFTKQLFGCFVPWNMHNDLSLYSRSLLQTLLYYELYRAFLNEGFFWTTDSFSLKTILAYRKNFMISFVHKFRSSNVWISKHETWCDSFSYKTIKKFLYRYNPFACYDYINNTKVQQIG